MNINPIHRTSIMPIKKISKTQKTEHDVKDKEKGKESLPLPKKKEKR